MWRGLEIREYWGQSGHYSWVLHSAEPLLFLEAVDFDSPLPLDFAREATHTETNERCFLNAVYHVDIGVQ